MTTVTCEKCGKVMKEDQFYTKKNKEKTKLCKKCLTMHIDNFNPETYLWILKELDVPYVESKWYEIRDKAFAKNPNLTGMSVLGKYLSQMKLNQFNKYGWEDTEKIAAEFGLKRSEADFEREQYDLSLKEDLANGVISEAEYKTLVSTQTQYQDYLATPMTQVQSENFYDEDEFIKEEELQDYTAELTADDKVYLAMKWGRLYKPAEWIELEKDYNDMMNSFDIQDADTINTLILLCKTNLKMNQAIDCGDVEGFQKLSKVSSDLRKSAKFTAAQNKEQKNDYVDSVGELVAMCERDGFIPRFATDIPQDKVDITLKDMNDYVHKLVTQDLGFGQQIEDALRKIQIQQEMAAAEAEDAQLMLDGVEPEGLTDSDYAEFYNNIEEQRLLDEVQGEEE